MQDRISRFFLRDLWSISLDRCSPPRAFLLKLGRMTVLAVHRLVQDQCSLRASALTLYTLLSIVPLCAMIFGIAQGFGLQDAIEGMVKEKLQGQEEVARWIIGFSYSLLKNTSGGWVAGAGVVMLFWTVMKLMQNIETSFNAIWKCRRPRTIGRKISDYLSMIVVSPVLLIASNSMMLVVAREIEAMGQRGAFFGSLSPLLFFALRIIPCVMIWLLFGFMYLFMPNLKVRPRSGVLAGVVAGSIYMFFQWVYIHFQVGMSQYNAVYGTFAALPLFIVWLQASWLIVLLGTAISFAHQNLEEYGESLDAPEIGWFEKKVLATGVVQHILKKFYEGEKSCSPHDIAKDMGLSIRLARRLLYDLEACGLLSVVMSSAEGEPAETKSNLAARYQPARPTEGYTLQFVIDAMESYGDIGHFAFKSQELQRLSVLLAKLHETAHDAGANLHLKDIS